MLCLLIPGTFLDAAPAGTPGAAAPIEVPAGFSIVQVAAPPLVEFPIMAGFDDRGRLFVAESTGVNLPKDALAREKPHRIRLLEDTDGDGIFDRSSVFADGFTFPQGALWHDGALYVASPPSIWRLEDTNGDGRADSRVEIATGFDYTGNAADVHGPFLHPNGRLYWCHGRKGHEVYQRDGTLVSKGLGARIWSSRPDGSDIRVHAGGGMDNPTELAFTRQGDIFGTVPLFHGSPRNDAVVHWIHGGVYPRADQQRVIAEFTWTGGLLPAAIDIGHVAPSGIAVLQSPSWGPEYRENVFFVEFNTRRLMRYRPEPAGSSFRGRAEVFAFAPGHGVHFTDVLEDADGSLLLIDTGAWFRIGCPTSGIARPDIPGAIYRIRKIGAAAPADPRGARIGDWARLDAARAAAYLADERPAVRERAMTELARKGNVAVPEVRALLRHGDPLARSSAVWTLTRIGSPAARQAVRVAFEDADAGVRQAACHSAGLTRDQEALGTLTKLLRDPAAAVRREAAHALGMLKNVAASPYLIEAAGGVGHDPHLDHALVYALIEIGDASPLPAGLVDPRAGSRRAAMIALQGIAPERLAAADVFSGLAGPNLKLREAALHIALQRPDWAPEAADYLEAALENPEGRETAGRVLAAFLGTPEVRAWASGRFGDPSVLTADDLSFFAEAVAASPADMDKSWQKPLEAALLSSDIDLAESALRALARVGPSHFEPILRQAARDPAKPAAFRVAALQAAAGPDRTLDPESFGILAEPFRTGGSPDARIRSARVLGTARLTREQLEEIARLLPSAGPVELSALLNAFRRAPAEPALADMLLAQLKAAPARWGLEGRDLQSLFRRFPEPAYENAHPMIRDIMDQNIARDSRLAELEGLIAGQGSPLRGRDLFLAGKGTCISCHRVGDQGGTLGPDLTHIGRIRNDRDLLEAIAFPEVSIARGYETFRVETRAGQTHFATIPRETADSVVLAFADGREIELPRSAVARIEPSDTSLMPRGLDRLMTAQELADLMAFLRTLD